MLLETFHWDPGTLAKADIDLVLPVVAYYPHWKLKRAEHRKDECKFADEVDWM